jgi:hypothetical protein
VEPDSVLAAAEQVGCCGTHTGGEERRDISSCAEGVKKTAGATHEVGCSCDDLHAEPDSVLAAAERVGCCGTHTGGEERRDISSYTQRVKKTAGATHEVGCGCASVTALNTFGSVLRLHLAC